MTPTTTAPNEQQPEAERLVRFLIRGALLAGATIIALRIRSDPDLWGHLRFGLDVLSTLSVHTGDPYSFTSDRAWINHEWLFEVIIAFLYTSAGTTALAVMAAIMCLATLFVARISARRAGMQGWRLDLVCIAVFLLGISPLASTMRPQAISSLLFVVLLAIMREFDRGRHRALLALPPLFLIWANVHGGWLVGGGVLALWTAPKLLVPSGSSRKLRAWLLGIGLASAAATFVNPYGAGLWLFLLETVRFERSDIVEWLPVTSSTARLVMWIATAVLAAAGLARSRREHYVYGVVCACLGLASFLVLRLVPFFSLATLLLLVPQLTGRSTSRPARVHARGLMAAAVMWALCLGLAALGESRVSCLK
ncbi:MAG: hypothetical protein ACRD2A_22365, partial [Vicinamibacterales bacterium]